MKINQIRQTIEALKWNRIDAVGGTFEENKRTNLPAIIAAELSIPNEFINSVRQIGDVLCFFVNGTEYDCRLTKTGKMKKGSLRRA